MQSGHLDERLLTSTFLGQGMYSIDEATAIRVLMRTDYRFFGDTHGFVTNIFDFISPQFAPNFVRAEILFRLMNRRKTPGAHGLEGYMYVSDLLNDLEEIGYERDLCAREINYLVERGLVESEELSGDAVNDAQSVKVHAAGWAHMQILASRIEFVTSCALTTQITDPDVARFAGLGWAGARVKGQLSPKSNTQIATEFVKYLDREYERACQHPEFNQKAIGSRLLMERVRHALALDQKDWDSRRHERKLSPPANKPKAKQKKD
jgi:hypothetical protein